MTKKKPRLDDVPTIAQFEALVKRLRYLASRKPELKYVLPLTLCLTGARIGEALALTTLDIDDNTSALWIPCEKKKEERKRRVPVPVWFIGLLHHYIAYNRIPYELFPISRYHAWRIVKRVTGYRPHALRHAYGMYLLFRGYSVEEVRRILGHESWEMVRYYVEVVGIDIKRRSPFEELT